MRFCVILLLLIPTISYAQNEKYKQFFDESLNFLIKTQVDSTIFGKQYAGEWEMYMNLTEAHAMIGRSQKNRDSNGFNTSAIHNFLSEIYLRDTSLIQLKPTLQRAFDEIKSYEVDGRFNFWKLLPPHKKQHYFDFNYKNKLTRRPTNFRMPMRIIHKAANIPEDADDTSLGNLAIHYHNQIFKDSIKPISYISFDEYLDLNRKNRHWYNFLQPLPPKTGAFLTWHEQEHQPKFWTPFNSFMSLMFIFLPFSPAFPEAYQPWIPFGTNDIDVVVNANVLSYLATTQQADKSKGTNGAIYVIDYSTRKQMWQTAATYYPNEFSIDFATSKAFHKGVLGLKPSIERIRQHLLASQQTDGSFESKYFVNNKDIIQSTAYALHAMLDLRESGIEIPKENIEKAANFLLSKAKRQNGMCSWEGGVYFSGGTLLRNILIWQSDAYTTALIANCLQRIK